MFHPPHPNLLLMTGGLFSPGKLSKVAGWARWGLNTGLGGAGFQVPDMINAGNPLTQPIVANQPSFGTANGYPIAQFDGTSDEVFWAGAGTMFDTVQMGFAGWMRISAAPSGADYLFAATNDSRIFSLFYNGTTLSLQVLGDTPVTSVQTATVNIALGTSWHFIYAAYDGLLSGPGAQNLNRMRVNVDGTNQTLTSVNSGGADLFPSTTRAFPSVTLGGRNTAAQIPCELGDTYATRGAFLTAAELANLTAFEARA